MSGYTDDEIMRRGLLESGATFLEKPFSPELLVRKVSQMLEANHSGPPAVRS
jgi:two-component system cell cycle sensor histidine kinase/response regulator CckA